MVTQSALTAGADSPSAAAGIDNGGSDGCDVADTGFMDDEAIAGTGRFPDTWTKRLHILTHLNHRAFQII